MRAALMVASLLAPVLLIGDPAASDPLQNPEEMADPPSFSIDDVEGSEDGGPLTFTVRREGLPVPAVLTFSTAPGSATPGEDYQPTPETLPDNLVVFGPTDFAKTITVVITADTAYENDETFSVMIDDPLGQGLLIQGTGTGTGTIKNDDDPPTVSIQGSPVVAEGPDAGAGFTASLTNPSHQPITVAFETEDGSAKADEDYEAQSGSVTFATGSTGPLNIAVDVIDDPADEPDETFNVILMGVTAGDADLGSASATATITDDDDPPSVSVDDVTVTEGSSGTTDAVFTVSLSALSGKTVTVHAATADATAKAGSDYTGASANLTFAPGAGTQTFTVPVKVDALDEPDEAFGVALTTPVNATLADATGVGTIIDDDLPPVVSVGGVGVAEGAGSAIVPVTLSAPSGKTVRVHAATANGSAVAGEDYGASSATLVFNLGQTAATLTVPVHNDALDEPDETFTVNLSSPENATLGSASASSDGPEATAVSATTTILDDDAEPLISLSDARVTEGNSGTAGAGFTVTLSAPSARTVTVRVATADGSATAGDDYTSLSGTGTFPPGATSRSFGVTVKGDTVDEPDEVFTVVLSSPVNAGLAKGAGTATVVDDDEPIIIPLSSSSSVVGTYRVVTGDGTVYVFDQSGRGRVESKVPTSASVVSVAQTPSGSGSWALDSVGGIFTSGDAGFFGSVPALRRQGVKTGNAPVIDIAASPTGNGYWVLDASGGIFTFGGAGFFGSVPGLRAQGLRIGDSRVVDVTATPTGNGYWVLDADGGVFTFGDARFFGSVPALRAQGLKVGNAQVVDIASTPSGNGYWVLDSEGGVFTFGDAKFFGSIPGVRAANPRVGSMRTTGLVATPSGNGYWVLDAVGGVFTFGDAPFAGSLPGIGVNTRVAGFSAG